MTIFLSVNINTQFTNPINVMMIARRFALKLVLNGIFITKIL